MLGWNACSSNFIIIQFASVTMAVSEGQKIIVFRVSISLCLIISIIQSISLNRSGFFTLTTINLILGRFGSQITGQLLSLPVHTMVFCVLLSAVPVSASNGVPNLTKKVYKYMILLHNTYKSIDCHYILAIIKKYSICVLNTRTSSYKNSKNKNFLRGKCEIHGNA